MMDLESAIRYCEEVAETNERICDTEPSIGLPDIYKHKDAAKKCASEHRQLAEWLKELKAYREQRGKRMNVEEKERLIKKDIESIENRVRHAFNQGYEMGLKERAKNENRR